MPQESWRSRWPQERDVEQSAPTHARHTHCTSRQLGTTAERRHDVPRDWLPDACQMARVHWGTRCNDFVARKVRTMESNKVQGNNWNAIKCKECLGSHPEAVVRQATINLDSWLWKSLGDSLPELYCVNLAEAYIMWENVSSRNFAWEEKVWFASFQRTSSETALCPVLP
jgi:hypothetical protein